MSTTANQPTPFTNEQLKAVFALLPGVDTVELKLTVPDGNHRSAVASLGMDPLEGQIRQVFFFDTPDLALNAAGLVLRARRIQGEAEDSVVKLRPVDPSRLSPKLRKLPEFGVEVDAMPGGFVCSARLRARLAEPVARDVAAGTRPIRKLFTKQQRALFEKHTPGVDMDDLAVLGPINVFKLKFRPVGLKRKLVAELWLYPDGSRILELSAKCLPAETLQVVDNAKMFLAAHGVDMTGAQETKTKRALEFFAAELVDQPG
jgi:hypothetical protein